MHILGAYIHKSARYEVSLINFCYSCTQTTHMMTTSMMQCQRGEIIIAYSHWHVCQMSQKANVVIQTFVFILLHYPDVYQPSKPVILQQTWVPNSLLMGVNYVDYEPQGTEVIQACLQTTP